MAVNVEWKKIPQSAKRSYTPAVRGRGRRSLVRRVPARVTKATIKAKGRDEANPYVSRWGFIGPIQVQANAPIHGLKMQTGMRPRIIAGLP